MVLIRLATAQDLPAIWQLRLKTTALLKERGIDQWQYEKPAYETFISDIEKKQLFIVTKEQFLCGMIAVVDDDEEDYDTISEGEWGNEEPYVVIHRLAVDPTCQGQGIGKMMLKFAESIAKQKNRNTIRVDTHRYNLGAQTLFLSSGFHQCGVITLSITNGDTHRLAFQKSW